MVQEQEESIPSTSFKPENFSSPYRKSFGKNIRQKQTINTNSLNFNLKGIRLFALLSIFVLLYKKMVIVSK